MSHDLIPQEFEVKTETKNRALRNNHATAWFNQMAHLVCLNPTMRPHGDLISFISCQLSPQLQIYCVLTSFLVPSCSITSNLQQVGPWVFHIFIWAVGSPFGFLHFSPWTFIFSILVHFLHFLLSNFPYYHQSGTYLIHLLYSSSMSTFNYLHCSPWTLIFFRFGPFCVFSREFHYIHQYDPKKWNYIELSHTPSISLTINHVLWTE